MSVGEKLGKWLDDPLLTQWDVWDKQSIIGSHVGPFPDDVSLGLFHGSKRCMTSQQVNVHSHEPMTDQQTAISWHDREGLRMFMNVKQFKRVMCTCNAR